MNDKTKKWHVCICQKSDKDVDDCDRGILLGLISGACDIDAEVWCNPIISINVAERYAPKLLQSPVIFVSSRVSGHNVKG
jgi:hypothetical protein